MDRIRSEACTVLAKFNHRALLNIAGFLPFLSLPGLSKSSGWLPNSVFKAHLHFLRFDGFYWVLLGFIRFYWVSLGFIRFHWYLLGFTGFFWALLSITGFLLSFTRFWLCSTGFYWVLLGSTGFYWVSPGFTESYCFNRFSWSFFREFTRYYWVLHDFTGITQL